MSVLMLISTVTFEGWRLPEAGALRVSADRDYEIGESLDYAALFESALVVVPGLTAGGTVSYAYRGRTVNEQYSATRHFATVAEAVAYFDATDGIQPVFYLCAGTYTEGRMQFPAGSTVLGANAGVSPNGYINFDLPDVTKGWDSAERYAEAVITNGIGSDGGLVVDGISYSGAASFFVSTDADPKSCSEFKVTVQNSLLSDLETSARFFDTDLSVSDFYGYDIKDSRITRSAADSPFSQNTAFIHTDGLYFYNNTASFAFTTHGFSSPHFSLDMYRSYLYKNSGVRYPIQINYTEEDHVSSLVFDKLLWYESSSLDYGVMMFHTTPTSKNAEYTVDIINSTFVADGSFNTGAGCHTFLNGNQNTYQRGMYTLNVNNNRIIGFDSMFPNVSDQAGTHKLHVDFNNNYFARTFTSVTDTLGVRSEYYNHTDLAHGSTAFNNIDYARIDLLNYYIDYAMTLSDKTFYVSGVSFFDDVDYVSIDNDNATVTVGMREGTVTDPELLFENKSVSARIYTDADRTKLCDSFSAPLRGEIATYYVSAQCGATELIIPLYVYGEDAVPYFKNSYSDKTGTLTSSAYLLCPEAEGSTVEATVDGTAYLFRVGENAFRTVDEILAHAGDSVPQILLPHGEYSGITINGDCHIIGQNRRSPAYTALDSECVRGLDWISGKTSALSGTVVTADNVTFSGVTFTDPLTVTAADSLTVSNSELTGSADIRLPVGMTSVLLSGIGVETDADALVTGELPLSLAASSCYFKNSTAVSDVQWSVDSFDSSCDYTVRGCRFDDITDTVVGDLRRGVASDTTDITLSVVGNVFEVASSASHAVDIKPSAYNELTVTDNRFVSKANAGAPIRFDTAEPATLINFSGNRFIGFAGIDTTSADNPPDGSYNYFAPYTEGYASAADGTVIPGNIYCSYYYTDYAMTTAAPAVTGYSFSPDISVAGNRLTFVCNSSVADLSGAITADCGLTVTDENGKVCDITRLACEYDTTVYTVSFYNTAAPCSKIDYSLSIVKSGSELLTVLSDIGSTVRNDEGVYVLTLPEWATGAEVSVVGHPEAVLSLNGTPVDSVTDIREGEYRDYIITVGGIRYRLFVTIPLSSGMYIDYDGVLSTAYIIGAERAGDTVSFYYRGDTVTQNYDRSRHFDSFDAAYSAYLATDPDIIFDTPVFVFAPGEYSAVALRYRAVILGANAGISPISTVARGAAPYTVPQLNDERSVLYTTRFYGTLSRLPDDGTLESTEAESDNRLELYTVIDGVDIYSDSVFFTESGSRRHTLSVQNTVSNAPLLAGGGDGDATLKNVYVYGADALSDIATDSLTVDGSYITSVAGAPRGYTDLTLKKSFMISCPSAFAVDTVGDVVISDNVISACGGISVNAAASLALVGNSISGAAAPYVADTVAANVDQNRFIGFDSVAISNASLGTNYTALNFTGAGDMLGLAVGDDYFLDYNTALKRSDFNIADISFDSDVHSVDIDNENAVISILITDGKPHAATFIPTGDGVAASLDSAQLKGGGSYTLTLSKGGYKREFSVLAEYEDIPYFAESDGIGDIKNTAVLVDPELMMYNGEGAVINWCGSSYKFVYGENLFASVNEARASRSGYMQMMLTAYDYESEFILPVNASLYGVNYNVDPNVKSDKLGDDWAKNPDWGKYGETEIKNITVPENATGTRLEIHGITLRGRIYDGLRPVSDKCTEFNIINTVIEHEDWMDTIYGGTSYMYTITLTNSNSASGENNTDCGMIKNMRVERLRVNSDIYGNRNRLLNERLPSDFTVDGLYCDMAKADCSLFGWMKMSDYQQNGRITYKNCNLRNAINVNSSLNLAFEGRDHIPNPSGDTAVATIDNCTFYNMQAGSKSALQFALQAYSEINVTNNLFVSLTTPLRSAFIFTPESTLVGCQLNVKNNRFVGTRQNIDLTTGTGNIDLSGNYYAPYSANYTAGISGLALTGTRATCSYYYIDYDMNFKNGSITPYAFGNGMVADMENKTLSLQLKASEGTTLSIAKYVTENPAMHSVTVSKTALNAGVNTVIVTVGGEDVYTLTVNLISVYDELSALADEVSDLVFGDRINSYTSASSTALKNALASARTALSRNESDSKLKSAMTALINARDGLVVDKSELNALIASAPKAAENYSRASYSALTSAIAAAEAASDSITPEQLAALIADIRSAIDGLVDISEYNAALVKARAYSGSAEYASATVERFLAEIESINASAVLDSKADVQRALSRIEGAYMLLVKDRVLLDSAIIRAELLHPDDYTVGSYRIVSTALEQAKAINGNSSQSAIDDAASVLTLSIDRLVSAREFNEALTRARDMINDGRYSQVSWNEFQLHLDEIEQRSQGYTTRADVQQGVSDVALAVAGLSVGTAALTGALRRYNALERDNYTAASLGIADVAYNKAVAVGNDTNATQQQIDDAATALNAAVAGLVQKLTVNAKIAELEAFTNDGSYCDSSVTAYKAYISALKGRVDSIASTARLEEEAAAAAALLKKHVYTYVNNNDATCKTLATETGSCSCGHTVTRQVQNSYVAHKYGEYVYNNDAAVGKDGTKTARCVWCGTPHTVTAEGTALAEQIVEMVDTTKIFRDVKAKKWYTSAINYAYTHGFIAGLSDTEFGINTPVTRGMFITILARIAGVDTSNAANKKAAKVFDDVKTGKYYSAAVAWANKNKIVAGTSDSTFEPNTAIERQQLCVMIVNFAKFQGITVDARESAITFADSSAIARYAKSAVKTCQTADIVNGYNENGGVTFRPKNTATRAEAAQILYKFHKDYVVK